MKWWNLVLFYLACAGLPVHAEMSGHGTQAFDRETALETSQAAIGRAVADLEFQDQRGNRVSIADYRGKPLVISLIYTSCYHICPTTTRHLATLVAQARNALGKDTFSVVSVGFDALRDNPAMMQSFAEAQGVNDSDWLFLSADQVTVNQLAADLGFQFETAGSGFDHLIQTSVIGPDGTVAKQIYGMTYEAPLLIEPIKQFVFGRSQEDGVLTALGKSVRLFCTVYDPAMERYKFDYSLFIGMAIGIGCVGLLGFQLVREWRKTLAAGL